MVKKIVAVNEIDFDLEEVTVDGKVYHYETTLGRPTVDGYTINGYEFVAEDGDILDILIVEEE